MPLPSASTGTPAALAPSALASNSDAGRSAAAAITRRDSRTAARDSDGAAITTRCPRAASSAEVRATNSLTSCRIAHGCGVTWTTESRSLVGTS